MSKSQDRNGLQRSCVPLLKPSYSESSGSPPPRPRLGTASDQPAGPIAEPSTYAAGKCGDHSAPAFDFRNFMNGNTLDWRRTSFFKKDFISAVPFAITVIAIVAACIIGFIAKPSVSSSIAWTVEGIGRSTEMQGQMYQPYIRELASYLSDTRR